MTGNEQRVMSNSEILAASKILLESRAFSKKEIDSILSKLIQGCASLESKKLVDDAVRNEKYHYVELHHQSHIQDKLWELNEEIQHSNMLEIVYGKAVSSKETVTRIVEPVAVLFSEYYFYLHTYIVEVDENGNYVHKYEYPAIFRIDRIMSYKEIGQKFKTVYTNRFEPELFREKMKQEIAAMLGKYEE